MDPTSPTGLRVNFSEIAVTEVEARARRKVNEMSGFGIYAPISARFNAPLDLDEIATRHADDGDFSDDAFYVINVTKGSPGYGRPVELDVGHGRYPYDLVSTNVYFPNDKRVDSPSLLHETYDEDVDNDGHMDVDEDLDDDGVLDDGEDIDGDGRLDVHEDTDNDGVLDRPNVYPLGGDPREDLLGWYERETDTLIFRPIDPMREETTYAVVLTERLIGEDGHPVRSPWTWVHHTRQTEALRPLVDLLPQHGLSTDDIAYAWTFTTGRITGDLRDLRDGLDGMGPYSHLKEEYPALVHGSMEGWVPPPGDPGNPHAIPSLRLFNVLATAGIYDEEGAETMREGYRHSSHLTTGLFTTPNMVLDRNGDGDTSDEWWDIDPYKGEVQAEPLEVAFTCAIPKPDENTQQPYPIAIYGHGYRSSRAEGLVFAWAMNRLGMAFCIMDSPGHGLNLGQDEQDDLLPVLDGLGYLPFFHALQHNRARDLNNDGDAGNDSGADQWISDPFHTRDMVRQQVVDWMQLSRAFDNCGTGSMGDLDGDGIDEVSCDWDADGVPDIGAGQDIVLMGGSLGGINAAVAAGVMTNIEAFVPVVAGGGLMDIGWRSDLGGVRQAVAGQVMNPLIMGAVQDDGSWRLDQYVADLVRTTSVPFARLDAVPGGGRFRVENLHNGEVREAYIPEDGTLRIGIPSDAPSAIGKRNLTGMPVSGPGPGETYSIPGNEGLGDPWKITIWDEAGAEVAAIDSFQNDAQYLGVTYPAGSPLVALSDGLGRKRGSPQLRRLVDVLRMVAEPGDPIAYAPHYHKEPFPEVGPQNVLLVPSAGDTVVNIATGVALARAAGMYDRKVIHPAYGTTVDRFLIDTQVIRGLEEHGPWTDANGDPALFDADDLDRGMDGTGAPSWSPLRATVTTPAGMSGLRIPYVKTTGTHGFTEPTPDAPFDTTTYIVMQMGRYLMTRGQDLNEDLCLESMSCEWVRTLPMEEE